MHVQAATWAAASWCSSQHALPFSIYLHRQVFQERHIRVYYPSFIVMEAAGAVAGFVGLPIALFQSCVQAFELLQTAQHIGADGDLFSTKLQWEQYQLLQWGRKVELYAATPLEGHLNWTLAESLLGQLESLLTSAEKLKTTYRLDVVEEDIKRYESALKSPSWPVGIGRWINFLKPELMTFKGQVIQKNNRALKRLRWAAMGKDQADAIICDIASLVSRLYQLLDSLDREKRIRVDDILLRNILSRSATALEVEQIQQLLISIPSPNNNTLQAAAKLKQIRLIIGADTREDEIKTALSKQTRDQMPIITKLKYKKLTHYIPDRPLTYEGTEFARYDKRPVLVEWKFVKSHIWKDMQQQVQCLAVLLASPSATNCQSLLCIGYLPWEDRELYALVYAIPGDAEHDDWSLKTLYDLIAEQRHFSLGRRFAISRRIAQVVLQLHTAGWLHKSLRSNNIIYIAPKGTSASEFLEGTPYLIGYEYARPDTAKASEFTQLPDTELNNDLYRHPEARGARRERYRKQFDVYALGCILLEIGMWQPLTELTTTFLDSTFETSAQAAMEKNTSIEIPNLLQVMQHQDLLDALRHATGDSFLEAFTTAVLMDWSSEAGSEASLDTHQAILDQLQKCKC